MYHFLMAINLQSTCLIASLDLNLPRHCTSVHEHVPVFQTSSKPIKTKCAWRRSLLSWSVGWDKKNCHCREVVGNCFTMMSVTLGKAWIRSRAFGRNINMKQQKHNGQELQVYMLQVNLFLRSICSNLGQFVPT